MTTEKKIKVMQAYTHGEAIQVSPVGFAMWSDLNSNMPPLWNWVEYDYRIKPEEKKPTYRPYKDTAEMIDDYKERFNVNNSSNTFPFIWIVESGFVHLITDFYGRVIRFENKEVDMGYLFSLCKYLDGTPMGKLVEE